MEPLLSISDSLGALLASRSLARTTIGNCSVRTRVLAITLGYPLVATQTLTVLGIFGQLTAQAVVLTVGIGAIGLAAEADLQFATIPP